MNNQQMEEIFNETFAGLTLFYRDATLSEKLISTYKVGQILLERGFTDMSYKGAGLTVNFRYLIASAKAKDASLFNPEAAQFGHTLLLANAYFKVLDIYQIEGKTQVFLLNIPEHAIELFKSSLSNIEQDIILKARKGFEAKLLLDPIKELQTQEWIERTEFPIGMNNKGELFPVDSSQNNETTSQTNSKTVTTENTVANPWWKFWK